MIKNILFSLIIIFTIYISVCAEDQSNEGVFEFSDGTFGSADVTPPNGKRIETLRKYDKLSRVEFLSSVDPGRISDLLHGNSSIKSLTISDGSKLSELDLQSIIDHKIFQELDIGTSFISDDFIGKLLISNNSLSVLSLYGDSKITIKSVNFILNSTSIKQIVIYSMTDVMITAFHSRRPGIKVYNGTHEIE
jgi:hypothetical protein